MRDNRDTTSEMVHDLARDIKAGNAEDALHTLEKLSSHLGSNRLAAFEDGKFAKVLTFKE